MLRVHVANGDTQLFDGTLGQFRAWSTGAFTLAVR